MAFMKSTCRGIVAIVVVLIASITLVTAQQRNVPGGSGMGPAQGGSGMGVSGGLGIMGMGLLEQTMGLAEHLEGRLAFLKTELKITDAQLPQWNKFADTLRSNTRKLAEMRMLIPTKGQAASMTAPERFDHIDKVMTAMQDIVQSTKGAVGPLYAALSDEQKKIADSLLRGPMGVETGNM
jgi:LTXXQ motif family protein